MRIAYLECFSGISGDMFLGALVDAGVPLELLEEAVASLDIDARIEASRVVRSGISATKVDVYSHGEKDLPREVYWNKRTQQQEHDPRREQAPQHDHHHTHGQAHTHGSAAAVTAPDHRHGRGLGEIREIIRGTKIDGTAKQKAILIFEALGEAEARIHGSEIEKVHFHEVGAVDAIVDITCAAVGVAALGVDEIVCSPLNLGGGTIECAHGRFPVPAPATLELLKHAPVYSSGINAELVTPTGAAIVKTLVSRFADFPSIRADKIGYGAGSRDFPAHANVARLVIGEAQLESGNPGQTISVLEANLDDLNPQIFGYVMDRLLDEGALDVLGIPVQMKKGRPGALLNILCRPEDANRLAEIVFRETTTLGVRQRDERRQVLSRRWVPVATSWGQVRIKVASMNGTVTNYAPEYEDCRRIAAEHQVPLKTVMQEAMQKYLAADD
jgi:uncharacterized protein (TIGR00299 family) protein